MIFMEHPALFPLPYLPLTFKAPGKMHLKMSSAEVVCCNNCLTLLANLSIQAKNVDPEQTAPIGAV